MAIGRKITIKVETELVMEIENEEEMQEDLLPLDFHYYLTKAIEAAAAQQAQKACADFYNVSTISCKESEEEIEEITQPTF